MSEFISKDIYILTSPNTKAKIGTKKIEVFPIGGKIFHIEPYTAGDYKFFDSNGNVLNDVSSTVDGSGIEHLSADCANVAFYIKSNPSAPDCIYVVGKDGEDNMGINTSGAHWTYYDTAVSDWHYNELEGTEDGIGKGKSNTALIMSKPGYIKSKSEMGQSHDTMWYWLKTINDANSNGWNDWFIGSKAELEILRTVVDSNGNHLTTWYDNYPIWSSYEYNAYPAWYWGSNNTWGVEGKEYFFPVVALRAF